jgi:hypothetical protein
MPQDYEVLQFKAGDYQDNNQNFWCDMALRGVGEPVRIVVRDPSQFHDGMTLYGKVTEETSRAGKSYLRFRREQKPEQTTPQVVALGATPPAPKTEWQPKDQNAIRAQWAIGQACGLCDKFEPNAILQVAQTLYEMVDVVKRPKADAPEMGLTPEEEVAQKQAKADAERIRQTFSDGSPVPDVVIEDFDENEPIDLNSIPF